MRNVRVLSNHDSAWLAHQCTHIWWDNCTGQHVSISSVSYSSPSTHVYWYSWIWIEEKLFFIIWSCPQCQNITVSIIKYFPGNHKCTDSHNIALNNFMVSYVVWWYLPTANYVKWIFQSFAMNKWSLYKAMYIFAQRYIRYTYTNTVHNHWFEYMYPHLNTRPILQ